MPQHAKRIKIRRKALRQPDEFKTLTGEAVSWASANRGLVTAVVVVLAVAGLAAVAHGRLATLYRGHALSRQGDAAGAATAYTEYLATSPEPPYLRQEALVGLGHAKEATGDATGALEAYVQAGTLDGPYRTDALLSAARLHEAAGQGDFAREIYTRLLNEAAEPEVKALARSKLPAQQAALPAAQQV